MINAEPMVNNLIENRNEKNDTCCVLWLLGQNIPLSLSEARWFIRSYITSSFRHPEKWIPAGNIIYGL